MAFYHDNHHLGSCTGTDNCPFLYDDNHRRHHHHDPADYYVVTDDNIIIDNNGRAYLDDFNYPADYKYDKHNSRSNHNFDDHDDNSCTHDDFFAIYDYIKHDDGCIHHHTAHHDCPHNSCKPATATK